MVPGKDAHNSYRTKEDKGYKDANITKQAMAGGGGGGAWIVYDG